MAKRLTVKDVELEDYETAIIGYTSEVLHIVTHSVKGKSLWRATKCGRLLEYMSPLMGEIGTRKLCVRCGDQEAFNAVRECWSQALKERNARWEREREQESERRQSAYQAMQDRLSMLADSLRANGFDVESGDATTLTFNGFKYAITECEQ